MARSARDLMAVLANLVPGMRRGDSCACPGASSGVAALGFLLGCHPYAGSRVRLTWDRELHSGRRGGVLSARVHMVLGMTLQCLGWWHSDGDGRTRPEVTEEMCSIIVVSQRCPGLAPGWWPYAFRGYHRPPSWGAAWGKYGSGQHCATEWPRPSRTVLIQHQGWLHSGELVAQRRDLIPRLCQGG
jgi:hypothetical protein